VAAAETQSVRAELEAILTDAHRSKDLFRVARTFVRDDDGAQELINSACVKILAGERARNREEYPDLVKQLGSIMMSLHSNTKTSADARYQRLHDGLDDELRVPDTSGSAETLNLQQATDQRTAGKLRYYLRALREDRAKDPQSLRLLDCFEENILRAKDQQEKTGWPIKEVRRVRRRLFDRAEIVMRTHPDDSGKFAAAEAL
jgi:hypothetical protein